MEKYIILGKQQLDTGQQKYNIKSLPKINIILFKNNRISKNHTM